MGCKMIHITGDLFKVIIIITVMCKYIYNKIEYSTLCTEVPKQV